MLRLRKDVKLVVASAAALVLIFVIYLALGGPSNPPQPQVDNSDVDQLPPHVLETLRPAESIEAPREPETIAVADPDPAPPREPIAPVNLGEPRPINQTDPWDDALNRNLFAELPGLMNREFNTQTPETSVTQRGPTAESTVATVPPPGVVPPEHRVQPGETLSGIALLYYGNARYHTEIARANPQIDPNRLRVGQVLKLPRAEVLRATLPAVSSQSTEPSINPAAEYRVQPGDSLHRIAERLFGDSEEWVKIYELNRQSIGPDPARLRVGQVLKLHKPPTRSN